MFSRWSRRWLFPGCLLGAAAGCHPQGAEDTPRVLRGAPVGLDVSAETVTAEGAVRTLAAGASLPSGARLAFRVSVQAPAYVYLAAAGAADAQPAVLYPPVGNQQAQPGERLRIPPAGQWVTLDQNRGQEDYFIYATRTPLSPAQREQRLSADLQAARLRPLRQPAPLRPSVPAVRPSPPVRPSDGGHAKPHANPTAGEGDKLLGPDELRGSTISSDQSMAVETDPSGVEHVRFAIWHR